MELQNDQIVVLRNGLIGVVGSFNNKPAWVIFKAYINTINKYNELLEHKNHNYDIVEIYDGSNVVNVNEIFTKSFNISSCKKIWERL